MKPFLRRKWPYDRIYEVEKPETERRYSYVEQISFLFFATRRKKITIFFFFNLSLHTRAICITRVLEYFERSSQPAVCNDREWRRKWRFTIFYAEG